MRACVRACVCVTETEREIEGEWGLMDLAGINPGELKEIRGSNPARDGIFFGSSHTSDFKIDTPVAILPGAWRYRVSAGTSWPGVSLTVT